jgi:Chromo (CHRromatin Organisation MOdifier) domain
MSTIQNWQKSIETSVPTYKGGKINSAVCQLLYGSYHRLATCRWLRFYPRCGRQREHKGGNSHPNGKNFDTRGAGQLLLDNLYKRFGLPDEMLSDRGPQFAAKAFRELLKLLEIKSNLTTAYHPQTDGATEQVNQEIEAYLSIYCSAHPTEWKNSLSTLEFTHNNQPHADWTHTSFELMNGEAPVAIPTTFENTKFPSVAEKIKNLVTSREEALAAHELARNRMAERIKSNFIQFKKGQMVWLDLRHLKTNYHKKMAPKWEGPFKIEEVLGPVTYQLKLPESWQIHKVFHAALLWPYRVNEVYGENYIWPPPDIEEREEVYEVEQILKHRKRGRGYEYLVKWVGYPITEASWEPKSNLTGCQGFTKLHSGRVWMDSGCRDLKNILIAILPWTTSDPSWEASAWWCRP